MFYAHFILSKKGPLARIWLAAHWEKKLTKAQIFDTDIDKAVDTILEPKVKMALRTKGHLLLGVCKIYSRKTKYLLADCNETCARMRMAFRPFAVTIDLPEDQLVAPFDAITNQEFFHDFDAAGLDISLNLNQSRYQDITMMENVAFANPDMYNIENAFGFGDEEEIEARRGASAAGLELGDVGRLRGSVTSGRKISGLEEYPSGNRIDISRFLEPEDVNAGIPVDNMDIDFAVPAPIGPAGSPGPQDGFKTPQPLPASAVPPPSAAAPNTDVHGMTTLLSNAADGFVLPPLDEATILGLSRQRGTRKRRRNLMIDVVKDIPKEVYKNLITDYKDTLRPFPLAPATKRMMLLKTEDSVDHLLAFPGIVIGSKSLYEQVFKPNLVTRQHPDEQGVDPSITLVDHEEPPVVQPDAPLQLEPIIEDVELERQHDEQPAPQDAFDQQPMEVDQLPPDDHQFVEPLLPPPSGKSGAVSPHGNENEAPLPFLNSVLTSPFVVPAVPERQAEGGDAQPGILAERNSSTPIPQLASTPRKSPRKDQRSRLSQQAEGEAADGGNNLDVSRASRASTTWDEKAQDILSKLKGRVNWLRENPSMNFEDAIDQRDTRKTVARKFYALLELKKSQTIDLKQDEPYGPIIISGGPNFDLSSITVE